MTLPCLHSGTALFVCACGLYCCEKPCTLKRHHRLGDSPPQAISGLWAVYLIDTPVLDHVALTSFILIVLKPASRRNYEKILCFAFLSIAHL